MTKFVPAYEVRTGRKLPDPVPEHLFDSPVWGARLRRTPRSAASKNTPNPPAAGENDKE